MTADDLPLELDVEAFPTGSALVIMRMPDGGGRCLYLTSAQAKAIAARLMVYAYRADELGPGDENKQLEVS